MLTLHGVRKEQRRITCESQRLAGAFSIAFFVLHTSDEAQDENTENCRKLDFHSTDAATFAYAPVLYCCYCQYS